ncbi:MAG: cytochrome c [Chloroflexi bacterium]|nr:cytochrome c [Chloroflexota bacterium]
MQKLTLTILLLLLFLFALTACGGGGDEPAESGGETNSADDVANGERLFSGSLIGAANAPGCATCHSLEPGAVIVGPSQSDVGARAAAAVAGMSAEDYLRQSIEEPDAHIAEGFTAGLMHKSYGEELTSTEINDLIAFMLTLK